jgi:hypothetical protein
VQPSCSWPGKALVTNPVKTCAKDGVTAVNPNDKSGCDGGSQSCLHQIISNRNTLYKIMITVYIVLFTRRVRLQHTSALRWTQQCCLRLRRRQHSGIVGIQLVLPMLRAHLHLWPRQRSEDDRTSHQHRWRPWRNNITEMFHTKYFNPDVPDLLHAHFVYMQANHFDLQIPGGGVGIFNGCSSQWGAPNDGWGGKLHLDSLQHYSSAA